MVGFVEKCVWTCTLPRTTGSVVTNAFIYVSFGSADVTWVPSVPRTTRNWPHIKDRLTNFGQNRYLGTKSMVGFDEKCCWTCPLPRTAAKSVPALCVIDITSRIDWLILDKIDTTINGWIRWEVRLNVPPCREPQDPLSPMSSYKYPSGRWTLLQRCRFLHYA